MRVSPPMASFGESLRRERELRGIDLREIAQATNISVRFLQAIEQDRLDVLPGGVFRRSFVRQYARYVGLDPERAVAEFLYAHAEEGAPEPRSARPRPALSQGSLLTLGAVALVGLLLLTRGEPERQPPAAGAPAPPPPLATADPDRVFPTAVPPALGGGGTTTLPAAAEPRPLSLTLSASQQCWVAVQVDGEPVLDRVMNAGETEVLEAQGEIVLSVGNAGGLSFRINDRPGVSLGKSGEVRRNIVITPDSLPTLVQESPAEVPSRSS